MKKLAAAKRMHRKLWDWLSKNPKKDKWDFPELEKWQEEYGFEHFCLPCAYVSKLFGSTTCKKCPVVSSFDNQCKAPYSLWKSPVSDKVRSELAKTIRDWEWKENKA